MVDESTVDQNIIVGLVIITLEVNMQIYKFALSKGDSDSVSKTFSFLNLDLILLKLDCDVSI